MLWKFYALYVETPYSRELANWLKEPALHDEYLQFTRFDAYELTRQKNRHTS